MQTITNLSRTGWPSKLNPRAKVHASTVRNTLHQFNLCETGVNRKPLLFKKNITRLQSVMNPTGKDLVFWNNVCQRLSLVTVTIDMFTTKLRQYLRSLTVKHYCETWWWNVIIWGCFAASAPRQLTVFESTLHPAWSQSVLDNNARPSERSKAHQQMHQGWLRKIKK